MVEKPLASHYATFRHTVIGFTAAVAVEHGSKGITGNAICPGAAETDLMKITGRKAAEAAGVSYETFLGGYAAGTLTKCINPPARWWPWRCCWPQPPVQA